MERENKFTASPFNTKAQTETQDSSKAGQTLIAIACITFFPLVYVIGRFVMQWIG